MKIKELLDSPEKWTQKAYAKNINGQHRFPNAKDACSWCLYGALLKCAGDNIYDTYARMSDYIQETLNVTPVNDTNILAVFNDSPTTKFSDIRKLVEALDI